MENKKDTNQIQDITSADILVIRLRKIKKTYSWLAQKTSLNRAYISQFFNHGYWKHLEPAITKAIEEEENSIIKVNENN